MAVIDNSSGGAPGLLYQVKYSGTTYSNNEPFTYGDAYDPDVCLVKGTSKMYALAAYHSSTAGNFVVDVFEWDSGNLAFYLINSLPISGRYKSAINIDANDNGQFIVVFDNRNDDKVHCIGGVAGTGPAFNYSIAYILNTGNTTPMTMPDVALSYGSSSIAYITYVDDRGRVQVYNPTWTAATNSGGDFTSTSIATITPPSTTPPAAAYEELFPRIGCPNSNGYNTDFTVVVCETDRTTYNIIGSTIYNGGSPAQHTYNAGAISPSLSNRVNLNPVVIYDSRSSYNIWVGWTYDDLTPATYYNNDAIYPVVVQCANTGALVSSPVYYEVPSTTTSSSPNNLFDYLSLAGRFTTTSNKMFITYNDQGMNSIKVKDVLPTASTFRIGDNGTKNNLQTFLNTYAADELLTLVIYDMTGRKINETKTAVNLLKTGLPQLTNEIENGIYLYTLNDKEGNTKYSCMRFKN